MYRRIMRSTMFTSREDRGQNITLFTLLSVSLVIMARLVKRENSLVSKKQSSA